MLHSFGPSDTALFKGVGRTTAIVKLRYCARNGAGRNNKVMTHMVSSALASCQSLILRAASAIGILVAVSAATPAIANSAAASSDTFRISPEDLKANQTALGVSDPEFRALNDSWGRINGTVHKVEVAVPSINPVEIMKFSSGYGYRNAPIRGASRNHKGLDIPGPVGTPIFATADGTIGRAEWVGGYGKFVEINHGNAVQTRYGHLSAMNVTPANASARATFWAIWAQLAAPPEAICIMKCVSLVKRSTRLLSWPRRSQTRVAQNSCLPQKLLIAKLLAVLLKVSKRTV